MHPAFYYVAYRRAARASVCPGVARCAPVPRLCPRYHRPPSPTTTVQRCPDLPVTRECERGVCRRSEVLAEVCLPFVSPSDFPYRVCVRVRAESRAIRVVLAQ